MSEAIKVTHNGVEITYDEQENVFRFTLRGRDRSAPSLTKAREFIDRPVQNKKAKPFERIKCWKKNYSNDFEEVEVTSVAEALPYESDDCVWISCRGERAKERTKNIFPMTEKNNAIVVAWQKKKSEIDALREEHYKLALSLSCLKIEKEED